MIAVSTRVFTVANPALRAPRHGMQAHAKSSHHALAIRRVAQVVIVDATQALTSSRALAAAVPRVRIEELFEIGEPKGRQLLFVPIARGSQSFEIAYDLCARLRIQITAPGLPQNTIDNFAHNAPALQ